MNIEEIVKFGEKVQDELLVLRNECLQYIKETLGDNGVAFFDNNDEVLSVTYDGGNHPENAYPYAVVRCVYTEKGKIYLDLEEAEQYDIDNITESISFFYIADHLHRLSFRSGIRVYIEDECGTAYVIDSIGTDGVADIHEENNPENKKLVHIDYLYLVES